jgi:phosphopantothenoylcysteine decarboxylase
MLTCGGLFFVFLLIFIIYCMSLSTDAESEWHAWEKVGDAVLHIDLRDWADLLLVCPLSAHSLAKFAHGLCDDVLSSVVRAWEWGHVPGRMAKPVLLAPAMNTAMWEHPLTARQLHTLQSFWNNNNDNNNDRSSSLSVGDMCGVRIVDPQVKMLACGQVGNGALASVDVIVEAVRTVLDDFCIGESL